MTETRRDDGLAVAAFTAFAAAAAWFQLSSYDLWWHLAAGRFMAATHTVPRADPFSFTARGAPWIDHEWLFQVVVSLAHQLGGSTGIIVLRVLLVAAAALLALAGVVRFAGVAPAAAGLLLVPCLLAGRTRFLERPELFTLVFAGLVLLRLAARREPPTLARDWVLLPLFALWANLHAGLIVGVVLLAALVVGRLAEGLPVVGNGASLARTDLLGGLALVVGAIAAGLVNPFFHRVYVTPFELTALIESGVYDNLEWRRPGLGSHWLFYLVLAVMAAVVLWRWRERRWAAVLPLLFLVLISLRYVRNVGLLCLLAPILVAAVVGRGERRRLTGIAPKLAATVLLVLAGWLAVADYQFPSGLGVDRRRVPVAGVDFLERHRPSANLYNVYGFGGYVAWRLWPEVATFIDGRNEVFAALRAELGAAVGDSRRWTELLDRYAINTALVSYVERLERVTVVDPSGGPPTTLWWPYTETHFPRRDWALVHFDDTSLVYLRRSGPDQALIAAHEVRDVYPSSADFQLEAIRDGRADPQRCLAELEAKLAEDPTCQRAARLRERVAAELGLVLR